MAITVILASSTHQELAAPENDEPTTVGAIAANACGDDVLDVLDRKPHLAYGCIRANRTYRAEKSIVVFQARNIRELVFGFAAVSVRYCLKWTRLGSGAQRNRAMVSLQPAGKKDSLIRQAVGSASCCADKQAAKAEDRKEPKGRLGLPKP